MTDPTAGAQWRVARLPEVFAAGPKGLENTAIRLLMGEDVPSRNAWMQHLVARAEIHAGKTPVGAPMQGFDPPDSDTAQGRVATRRGAWADRKQAYGAVAAIASPPAGMGRYER